MLTPSSHVHQGPSPSLPSLLPLSLPFLDLDFDFDRDLDRDNALSFFWPVSGGSSAKDTRFGVDLPLDPLALKLRASETLNQLPLNDGAGDTGVGGAVRLSRSLLTLFTLPFSTECLGGLGGLVECVWRAFVRRRDTLAVAWEVSATGATVGGVRNGGRWALSFSVCLSLLGSFEQ